MGSEKIEVEDSGINLNKFDFGKFMNEIDQYLKTFHCTTCVHFDWDREKTLKKETERINVEDKDSTIKNYYGKCLKRNIDEVKADISKSYKKTQICYENELKL